MKTKFFSTIVLLGALLGGIFFTGCQNPVIAINTDKFDSSQNLNTYKGLGFDLKAFNGNKQAKLSVVKVSRQGFGVANSTPSNELGNDSSILVAFDYPVMDANVSFAWLGGREMAKVDLIAYDGVTILKSFTFKNGTDGVDTYANLSLKNSPNFKYMRFSAVGNGSDFLINDIQAVVSKEPSKTELITEKSEVIKLTPDKPKPVKPIKPKPVKPVKPTPVKPVTPKPVKPSGLDKNLLVKLVNEVRAKGTNCGGVWHPSVGPIKWNDKLEIAAKRHSDDMFKHNHFDHTGTDGSLLRDRINDAGYEWSFIGENIASGYPNERAVIAGWLRSTGHCKNIMNGNFKDMGIAKTGKYWTQDFGTGWN